MEVTITEKGETSPSKARRLSSWFRTLTAPGIALARLDAAGYSGAGLDLRNSRRSRTTPLIALQPKELSRAKLPPMKKFPGKIFFPGGLDI